MVNHIDYGALIDEAMHIIVKKSLEIAVARNMPGEHHFFISFLTKFPGVALSEKLKNRYPHEMTIVLQFQFEDLKVEEKSFSVTLSFDNVKEKIVIPFASITAFADPSVKFGLQFRHIDVNSNNHPMFDEHHLHTGPVKSDKKIQEIIKESGATNVITLDSFRNKHDK
jgi:hypothetical protein